MKTNKIKEERINKKIIELKSKLKEIKEIELLKEQDKKDNVSKAFFVFFLIFLPLQLVISFTIITYKSFYRLFKIYYLTREEKKEFYIGGKFNPCEYQWRI